MREVRHGIFFFFLFLYSISMFRATKCLKMKVDQRTGRTGKKRKRKRVVG